MPADDKPLPSIRTGSQWVLEVSFYADFEETDPRLFADGDTFSAVFVPFGYHQPEPERVYAVAADHDENTVEIDVAGNVSAEFAPGKYLLNLNRTTDPDNVETLYEATVTMKRGALLVSELGGGVELSDGGSSGGRVVAGVTIKVVTGYTGGAAIAERRANLAAENADEKTALAVTATAAANEIVDEQEALLDGANTVLAAAGTALQAAGDTRDQTALLSAQAGVYKDASYDASTQAAATLATILLAVLNGSKHYQTYALLTADFASLPNGIAAEVLTGLEVGTYIKVAGNGTPVKVSTDTVTTMSAKLAAQAYMADDDGANYTTFTTAPSLEDVTRVVRRFWHDNTTNVFHFDRLHAHSFSADNQNISGRFTTVDTRSELEAVKNQFVDGSLGQVETGSDRGFYERVSGEWVLVVAATLADLAARSDDDVQITTDGKTAFWVREASDDPDKVVNVGWVEDADPEKIHLAGVILHDAEFDGAASSTTQPTIYESSYTLHTSGAKLYRGSSDNEGKYQGSPLRAGPIYVINIDGQSHGVGQQAFQHLPIGLDPTVDAMIRARAYTPLTTVEQNPYPDKLLMPDCGSHVGGMGALPTPVQSFSGFIPMCEYYKVPAGQLTPAGESLLSQCVFTIAKRYHAAFPLNEIPTIVGINTAFGASAMRSLDRGSWSWGAKTAAFLKLAEIGKAQGREVIYLGSIYCGHDTDQSFNQSADPWNPDPSNKMYVGMDWEALAKVIRRRRSEEAALARSVFNQSWEPRLWIVMPSHGVGNYTGTNPDTRIEDAIIEASRYDPYVVNLGSKASLPEAIYDLNHPSTHGYSILGQLTGFRVYEDLFGPDGWHALKVTTAVQTGPKTIRATLNKPWTFITDDKYVNVSQLGNGKGFLIRDGFGSNSGAAIASVAQESGPLPGRPSDAIITTVNDLVGPHIWLHTSLNGGKGTGPYDYGQWNRTGARAALRSAKPMGFAEHFPPVYAGETNDDGAPWFDYGDSADGFPIWDLLIPARIKVNGR